MTLFRLPALIAAAVILAMPAARAEPALFQPWINGVADTEPQMQVQAYDADTFVIRQSIRTNFEGPFLYLLFGRDRALLFDSGAGGLAIRPVVEQVIAGWLTAHGRAAIPLVIAHSHSHHDHHQGDVEFEDRPDTSIVGLYTSQVADFFKLADWPNEIGTYDLGDRVLDVIPTPGHQVAHIMLYDEKTRLLLSGDALCACRLYFPTDQFAVYRDGIDRVIAFTRDHPVSHILGAHIEMTGTPGELITDEAPSHPQERALELPVSTLAEVQTALRAMGDTPREEAHADFVVFPVPPRPLPPASPPPGQ